MDPENQEFGDLCEAVARGDSSAAARFRDRVVPCLHTIVRRALRSDRGASPVRNRIQVAARRFGAGKGSGATRPDELCVNRLAQRVCDLLIRQLRSARGSSPYETVVRLLDSGTFRDRSTPGSWSCQESQAG